MASATRVQSSQSKYSGSLVLSLILHLICFAVLFGTLSNQPPQPIMVNLLQNPDTGKTIKAGLINKKNVDQVVQRHVEEQQEKLRKIEEERQAEIAKREAEERKALELEQLKKIQEAAAKKAEADKQALLAKQAAAKEQAKQKLAKLEADRKQQAKLDLEKKNSAVKQAAALKAEHDRKVAEHNALIQNEVDLYKAKIAAAVEENRILSSAFVGDIVCKIRLRLLPDGSILNLTIVQRSGNPAYDSMSESAVHKAAPFPMPADPELYEHVKDIVLSFRNGETTDA
jgi:colicin import membrane protein